MPAGTDPNILPENWFCYNHPDPAMAALSHTAPEEEYKVPAEAEVRFWHAAVSLLQQASSLCML